MKFIIFVYHKSQNYAKFPIGTQTLRELIEGDYLYVDKTGIATDMVEHYKYVFLLPTKLLYLSIGEEVFVKIQKI